MNFRNIVLRGVTLFGMAVVSGASTYHVDITPEMLLQLRASDTVNASRPIMEWSRDHQELLHYEERDDNATILTAESALSRAFNVLISMEGNPRTQHKTFAYTVFANERLIDALERLMKANEDRVRWRLVGGRIVFSSLAPGDADAPPPIGDRIVRVDIHAERLYEAILQLESAYNEQHRVDLPLVIGFSDYPLVIMPAADGPFSLQAEKPMREIMVDLLNQMEEKQTRYLFGVSSISPSWKWPDAFYEKNLKYYSITVYSPTMPARLQPTEIQGEGVLFNQETVIPGRQKRLRMYFEWHYPELSRKSTASQDN